MSETEAGMTIDVTQVAKTRQTRPSVAREYCEPLVHELPLPSDEPAGWADIW